MTTLVRRLIILAIGLLAGICVWPLAELILYFQGDFPSYLAFLPVLGAIIGAVMGAFFGAAEGITTRIRGRLAAGMALGAAIGLAGGALGALAGQAVLWITGNLFLRSYRSFQLVVLPVSRAVGWAVLGIFVGVVEGVRARSPKKIAIGAIGGLVGGLVGGFALEYSRLAMPHVAWSRLLGLAILGMAIAGFYALIERGMSFGVLRLLSGPRKGKEYLVNQGRIRVGRARGNEIALPEYGDLGEVQARIRVRRGEVTLTNLDPAVPMLVNDQQAEERRLRLGDVIRIGSARFYYRYE
jgi:hypothetical protein